MRKKIKSEITFEKDFKKKTLDLINKCFSQTWDNVIA